MNLRLFLTLKRFWIDVVHAVGHDGDGEAGSQLIEY